ncbi:uncharacterized protein LOC107793075 isoform X2 [Nicotiana tabacum]|uniref:UDP-N-acetylglucosamine--N-acetylmuramyl- (Pentapeptide) pyrophosphoryl-undecaprenol N-acetylglucosamine transferase isoform X2 n=1 Tax=Nicotiana tabacum TaxID=4097 RepID=A0A1S4A2L6_TOBAC|nr:PREDICTED: UDP-N-acetylglucosamine--N-acetylmuramyl-(pentapeptide) pyrophosphoryl-undecaprenol N-acetylglucosamine transferase-like isoform X2 [Nicotiana tabacum]
MFTAINLHSQLSLNRRLFLTQISVQLQSRNLKISSCLSLNKPKDQTTNASTAAAGTGTDTLRIILAAGGTGGHIYPAIAIADDLKTLDPNAQILFVGLPTGMESTAVPTAGYSFTPIQAAPLGRPFISLYNNKCVVCGNPVRLSLRQYASKAVARRHFFSKAVVGKGDGKVVLILGGSLGANALNVAILHLYSEMLDERKDLFLIWQTGVLAFDEMESLVKFHPRLYITPFLHSMDLAYSAADLIVSRAGAMICSEILAAGKPCILIPSPNVAEGHQFHNACLMADVAGSRVITEDELDSLTLKSAIEEILDNEGLMTEMSERALKAAKPDASVEIAKHILSLVNFSSPQG